MTASKTNLWHYNCPAIWPKIYADVKLHKSQLKNHFFTSGNIPYLRKYVECVNVVLLYFFSISPPNEFRTTSGEVKLTITLG